MYLKKLAYRNVGPLKSVDIELSFTKDGEPKPLIAVGENGSGKSALLSNIVDALIEAAGKAFDNVQPEENGTKQYFKIISPHEIKIGEDHLIAYIQFDQGEEYIFKSGSVPFSDVKEELGLANDALDWREESNFKKVTFTRESSNKLFDEGVICYFGPNRYELPSWMGEGYLNASRVGADVTVNDNYARILYKPVVVQRCISETLGWLVNLIADTRSDLVEGPSDVGAAYTLIHNDMRAVLASCVTRKSIEDVMSVILGVKVYFDLGHRNLGGRRLSIKEEKSGRVICPSLDSLSTGQLALFDMFATIVRYADKSRLDAGAVASSIKGIVVIDEVDLHLHTDLQRNVLPRLMKLFPSIQFIVTTHSPLVLLGIKEFYGEGLYDLIELPSGDAISVEDFSEFGTAYDCYTQTRRYRDELHAAIEGKDILPLVVTEGKTDWKHIKAAKIALSRNGKLTTLKEFELFEYESQDVGINNLIQLTAKFSFLPQPRKVIFIADSDHKDARKELKAPEGEMYRNHGNGVYSLLIPTPDFRADSPNICIEQLYPDDIIHSRIVAKDGVERELYLSSDFDDMGRSELGLVWTEAIKKKRGGDIVIVDGNDNHVINANDYDNNTNLALTKNDFAEYMLKNVDSFSDGRFDAFISLFENIDAAIGDSC